MIRGLDPDFLAEPTLPGLEKIATHPIVFFGTDADPRWADKITDLRRKVPHASVVLLLATPAPEVFARAVAVGVDYLALPPGGAPEFSLLVERAVESSVNLLRKEGLLRTSSREVREFERMQESLEKMVEERTFHIQASLEEEEKSLQNVRTLIRWIRDLSQSTSLEEVLLLLKGELKPLHAVADSSLVVDLGEGQRILYSLARGQLMTQPLGAGIPEIPVPAEGEDRRARGNLDVAWSQAFANLLGRPAGRIIAVSLDVPLIRRLGFPQAKAHLLIENSFSAREQRAFFDEQGERVRSLAITVDRILLEDELTRYSYRWERTFDGLAEPLAIIDARDAVVRSNRSFSDRSRHGPCYELFQGRKDRCPGCPIPAVLASRSAQKGEVRKGDRVYEVHSYPIFLGRKDVPSNFVSLYVDVTNKRDLTQKYIQTEKMSALGLLAGHIAHELNNPLTGLRSMAQLLAAEAPAGSQLQADFKEVEKAAARSEKTIRHLIEFVDMEGKDVDWISLDEIVERTLPLLKMTTRNHNVQLSLNAAGGKIRVHAHLLQQVVFNLITNACQAMEKNGTLTITTSAGPAGRLTLSIADTGTGIPPEIQTRIFEPFFTTKPAGLGTGLGLSLSREIVERFGGVIALFSEPGKGSRFDIIFTEGR